MFCRNCGVENEDNAKFCRNCGSPIETTDINEMNNNKTVPKEKNSATLKSKILNHLKIILFKLVGIFGLIYSFGFLVNILYSIQSSIMNIIHLPLVQCSVYLIIIIIVGLILWIIYDIILIIKDLINYDIN